MIVPTAVLVLGGVALGIFAGPVYDLSERVAHDLLDPAAYLTGVLGE